MRRDTVLIVTVMAIGLAILCSLGWWQVQRLAWKQDLIADIEARTARPAVPLGDLLAEAGDHGLVDGLPEAFEYRPVIIEGTFDHDHEQHFFATHKGMTGYYLYTPMLLEAGEGLTSGKMLFVNRGFVPFDRKQRDTRPESLTEGTIRVDGLFRHRLNAKPSSLVPDNDVAQNIYYWKDLDAMVEAAGINGHVLPFFVDALPYPENNRLPIGGVTQLSLTNNHLQYAVTWFGLALALLGVGSYFLYGRRQREDI